MNYGIHPDLDKILSKLSKKDKIQFEAILRKIDEIKDVENIDHYKNLKSSLEEYKRVHVYSSFVLLFKKTGDTIIFRYYDHHDNIYKWRPKG